MSNLDLIQQNNQQEPVNHEPQDLKANLDAIEVPPIIKEPAKEPAEEPKVNLKQEKAELRKIEQVKIPSDPVVVIQVLQVLDRDKYSELEAIVREKEDVKDAIEATVNKIYKKQSGIAGFVSAAFKGRKIPEDCASELDVLVEYQQALEIYIDDMVNAIAKSRELTEKSEINADQKNKLVLRQRAIMELENVVETFELEKLRKNCEKLLKSKDSSLEASS